MNKINLVFDQTLTCLVGNQFGYNIYLKQIKENLNEEKNLIIFPNEIERVAISFVQGMFRDLIAKYGKEDIFKYLDISAKDEKIRNKIIESIKF